MLATEKDSPMTAPNQKTDALLDELEEILSDWPTMRALSAYGAEKATGKKMRAREIVASLREQQ